MASPAMNEYFRKLAEEHRALAAVSVGTARTSNREKADQYERLAGLRDLYRGAR
jgi:hypothetical protein